MTPEEIKTEIGNRLNAKMEMVATKQEQFKAGYGIYFQLLPTHSVIPANGEELILDRTNRKPHYQNVSGADMGGLPEQALSSTKIDTYQGPSGQGYTITSSVMIAEELWERTINFGPEIWRNADWQVIQEGEI